MYAVTACNLITWLWMSVLVCTIPRLTVRVIWDIQASLLHEPGDIPITFPDSSFISHVEKRSCQGKSNTFKILPSSYSNQPITNKIIPLSPIHVALLDLADHG
jgi:hypothetical protein